MLADLYPTVQTTPSAYNDVVLRYCFPIGIYPDTRVKLDANLRPDDARLHRTPYCC